MDGNQLIRFVLIIIVPQGDKQPLLHAPVTPSSSSLHSHKPVSSEDPAVQVYGIQCRIIPWAAVPWQQIAIKVPGREALVDTAPWSLLHSSALTFSLKRRIGLINTH